MKQRLTWSNLKRGGTRNGLYIIKETFTENLQLEMSVLCTNVWEFSKAGLSSWYMMAGQNKCKEKVPVSDPNQNVERTCNSKCKFT